MPKKVTNPTMRKKDGKDHVLARPANPDGTPPDFENELSRGARCKDGLCG